MGAARQAYHATPPVVVQPAVGTCAPPQPGNTHMAIDFERELKDGFAARYAAKKARQLKGVAGLGEADLDDVRQELLLHVYQARERFDPEVSGWKPFVIAIVDRRIASLLAAREAEKREFAHDVESLGAARTDADGGPTTLAGEILNEDLDRRIGRETVDPFEEIDQRLDVDAVLDGLDPEHRELAEHLRNGLSARRAAEKLGISRRIVAGMVERLRAAFTRAGLAPAGH